MGVMMVLTYDTIFEVLLREKSREELQKLDEAFFDSLKAYLRDKKQILKSERNKLDVFSFEEKEKTARQLENVYRLLRELYERREKKIVNLALIKSRTGSDVIDSSGVLERETALFLEAVEMFDRHRKELLINLVSAEPDDFEEPRPEEKAEKAAEEKPVVREEPQPELNVKTKLVRMLSPVPKFVGPELEVYGPFDEDDVASLPEEIANVLVSKGRAEEMEG